jgi:murein DD-endopeptidase MepM/ murein hydrolase activator NlpD
VSDAELRTCSTLDARRFDMVAEFRGRRWLARFGLGSLLVAFSVLGAGADAGVDLGVDAEVGADAGAGLAAPLLVSTDAVRSKPRWNWPVRPPVVERPFEAPQSVYSAGHRGIDLGAPSGTAIVAPGQATVRFAGVVIDRPVLTLDHGDGVLSSYEPLLSELAVGDTVAAGQHIGVLGSGGHCGSGCLHVGVRVDGRYVSPLLFFDRVPRAILLPVVRPAFRP